MSFNPTDGLRELIAYCPGEKKKRGKIGVVFWKRYQQPLHRHIYLREDISDGIGQNEIVEYHLAVPWNLNFRYQAILKEKSLKDFQVSAKYGARRTLHTGQVFTVLLDAYLYTKGC